MYQTQVVFDQVSEDKTAFEDLQEEFEFISYCSK